MLLKTFLNQKKNSLNPPFQLKNNLLKILVLFLIFSSTYCISQEYRNLKTYKKETGILILEQGCWLKKDRVKQNTVWKNANEFNLINNNYKKYQTINQIRDFYIFTQKEIALKGHEVNWISAAATIASQFSIMQKDLIRILFIRNKKVIKFANEGSKKVLEFSFPKLKNLYFSEEILTEQSAKDWDYNLTLEEQCDILNPIYQTLSKKTLKKLERMAKGKGIFGLGVSKKIRFEGEINDCKSRYNYTVYKLIPYCHSIK